MSVMRKGMIEKSILESESQIYPFLFAQYLP